MKAQSKIGCCILLAILAIGFSAFNARAFSLLGPVQPWMQASNGVVVPGDIGGPMQITNEYRWNVPVVTYGFDQSFLDFFGSNGVAAVESAFQILNDLPPASQMILTNYPFDSQQINYTAQAGNLVDLRSQALSLLLAQLGLAPPTRNIYVLKEWNPILTSGSYDDLLEDVFGGTIITNYVVPLNYDPESLSASPYVNEVLYNGLVYDEGDQHFIEPFSADPLASVKTAVADFQQNFGEFYNGLTRDDVGGLAYLLSTNNVNYETLLPGVFGVGTNADSYVNGAWRPGVDKITFVQVALDPLTGELFSPLTNCYTDHYITNGVLVQQQVARVIYQPDILFSVEDVNSNSTTPSAWLFYQTGKTNWINNAASNGNPGGAGPGVIQPPAQIVFNKLGRQIFSYVGLNGVTDETTEDFSMPWGTFDGSTNAPIIYPVSQMGSPQMTVRMWLTMGSSINDLYINPFQRSFEWSATCPAGTPFAFQTTSNLTDWVTLFTVTNNGTVNYYFVNNPASAARFYRLAPQ